MELRSITVETLAAFAQALRAEERCTETIKQQNIQPTYFAIYPKQEMTDKKDLQKRSYWNMNFAKTLFFRRKINELMFHCSCYKINYLCPVSYK